MLCLKINYSNLDIQEYMPKVLMIPIETFKKIKLKALMIPIETFKTFMPTELMIPIEAFK